MAGKVAQTSRIHGTDLLNQNSGGLTRDLSLGSK
jgi:hypothetical protein